VAPSPPVPIAALEEPPTSSPAAPGPTVRYIGDTLSVRASGVPIAELLDEIGQQSGATVRGRVDDERDLTTEFDDVPLAEGLHRILGEQNFILVYDHEHRLRLVELIGGPTTPSPVPVTITERDVPSDVLARHPRVHLGGPLSVRFGTDTITLHDLIEQALRQEDGDVRADAMRTAVEVLEADPEFRHALHATAAGADGAPLDSLVRGLDTARAEQALFYVATKATDGELRDRAVTVLDRMHGGTGRPD